MLRVRPANPLSRSPPNTYTILDKPAPLAGQYTSECHSLITRFLRYYLTKPRPLGAVHPQPPNPPPNSSYETIFSAWRTIVSATKNSGDLYDQVRMQLERCVGELAQDLGDKKEKGVQWIKPFNDICEWFEGRVVSGLGDPPFRDSDTQWVYRRVGNDSKAACLSGSRRAWERQKGSQVCCSLSSLR